MIGRTNLVRSRAWSSIALGGVASIGCVVAALAVAPTATAQGSATIGYVITDLRYALQESADPKQDCSNGLQPSEVEQFKRWPGHLEQMTKYGGTFQNRGPGGVLATYVPLAVEDPLPFSEVITSVGHGLNLDGTEDGRATAKTLAHEKFVSPSGEKVDNQMARVLGCVMGWRKTGFMVDFHSKEIEQQPYNRLLIEISGVDDEKNDPDVTVTLYKGLDRLVRSPDGTSFIPYMSHRVDHRAPEFTHRVKGRIVDGVLSTDPIPYFRQIVRVVEVLSERRMRDVRLRLKLEDNTTGILAGYENLVTWWNVYSKSPGSDIGRYSPAAIYKAALRYADGFPDPATGQATAISTAYNISAVRAIIVHPKAKGTRIAVGTKPGE